MLNNNNKNIFRKNINNSKDLSLDNLKVNGSFKLNSTQDALLLNRLTTTERNNISIPENGMIIYNTTLSQPEIYQAGAWIAIGSGSGDISKWTIAPNEIDIYRNTFIGIGEFEAKNPDTDLHIYNSNDNSEIYVEAGASNISRIKLYRGNTNNFSIDFGSLSTSLAFRYNNTELFRIQSSNNAVVTQAIHMSGTTGTIRFNVLTTTQRDALTPSVGDTIYNTTLAKVQSYEGSAWVTLSDGASNWTLKGSDVFRTSNVAIGDFTSETIDADLHIKNSGNPTQFKMQTGTTGSNIIILENGNQTTKLLTDPVPSNPDQFRINIDNNSVNSGNFTFNSYGCMAIGTSAISNNELSLNLSSTTKALKLNVLDSTAISALTPGEGWLVFNTTTKKAQCYDGSAWNDLF